MSPLVAAQNTRADGVFPFPLHPPPPALRLFQVHVIGFRALPAILHDMAAPGTPIHATGVAQLEAAFAAVGEAAGTNTISDEFASRMSTEMDNKIINEFL